MRLSTRRRDRGYFEAHEAPEHPNSMLLCESNDETPSWLRAARLRPDDEYQLSFNDSEVNPRERAGDQLSTSLCPNGWVQVFGVFGCEADMTLPEARAIFLGAEN